jgi:hypothetical protein
MGRLVKDYWNWNELVIPYRGDWKKHIEIQRFLESKVGTSNFHILVEKDYPTGKRRGTGDYKTINKYFYRIKDEKVFTFLSLKYS